MDKKTPKIRPATVQLTLTFTFTSFSRNEARLRFWVIRALLQWQLKWREEGAVEEGLCAWQPCLARISAAAQLVPNNWVSIWLCLDRKICRSLGNKPIWHPRGSWEFVSVNCNYPNRLTAYTRFTFRLNLPYCFFSGWLISLCTALLKAWLRARNETRELMVRLYFFVFFSRMIYRVNLEISGHK